MSGSPLVELRDVSFRHPSSRRSLLPGVSLSIYPGDRLLITGPSGAGKSTLLSLIAGFVPRWVPGSVGGHIERRSEEIAFVFQNPEAQMVAPTIEEEIAFGLENRSTPRGEIRRRIDEVLTQFALTPMAGRNPAELSGGERQKVALAAAFALHPRLLLLDEPTSYLDPEATAEFFVLLEELPEATAVVMVEHKIEQAERFARRLALLDEEGNLSELDLSAGMDRDSLLPWRLRRLCGSSGGLPDTARDTQTPPVVETRKLSHTYSRGVDALRALDLRVAAGETVAVMGPNGAGKSTLLEKIAGTLPPQRGEIKLNGLRTDRMKPRDRFRRSLYLPQNPEHFFLRELVEDELALAASPLDGGENGHGDSGGSPSGEPVAEEDRSSSHRSERLAEGIRRFRLERLHGRNPYSLSEGEKRRLNLACAFLDERPLLLLDEPTFGLDFSAFEELVSSLRTLKEAGRSLLLVTHSPELAFLVADRILFMEGGTIVFEGRPEDALDESATFPDSYLPVWERRRSLQR